MKYVSLGKTGIKVSEMCVGSLTVGPLQADLSIHDGAAVLVSAVEAGINFFDTAELYGTYPYLREAMKVSGQYDIVISSKTFAYTKELAKRLWTTPDMRWIEIILIFLCCMNKKAFIR